ncbi:hypothetical protein ACFO5Q_03920 [Kordiimonas lipolytica]|uniref:Beta protein n=1 Tax=Kordiimonas lipolytica TaxID=1662421 RepID=A0ABV8U8M6_9PROT|nr:hypothetical protein [Kordiimonas lipolytica]
MVFNYFLLFKTAQAEFRAWDNLNDDLKPEILPIIEITRGRKIPRSGKDIHESQWPHTPGIYDFEGNWAKVRHYFKECNTVVLDLTREEELSCHELDQLTASHNGYEAWVQFVRNEQENFHNLLPTLIINPAEGETDEEYKANILSQLASHMETFDGVAYRASILIDPDFFYDLLVLKDMINSYLEAGKRFYIELDHEFIRPGTGIVHAARTSELISRIREIIPKAEIVILSTSFPRSVEDIGEAEHDSFSQEEVLLFDNIFKLQQKNNPDEAIHYGDYGSINPIRNDIIFATAWRPRIDFPTSNRRTYYYREKRGKDEDGNKNDYGLHYASVARKVKHDSAYELLPNSWGVRQIELAARSNPPLSHPPGKSPSFWISVRMEIHILQQLRRLSSGHQ